MIFTSLGLLVVATILLIAGIMKSSVALLVLSVIATLAGCATLYASFLYYRRKAAEDAGGSVGVTTASGPAAAATGATAATAVGGRPNGNGAAAAATIGWDVLEPERAAQLVETLNLDELHDLRRHEIEHAHRADVLAAIDARIESIVAVRRNASSV